ncbi:ABC transporter permease [Marinomonas transparens]|uniref:ABC transporter permease n=1 Tax=Marinomonas transparens TaxID=2795388 RepID=A0A934N2C3_9GAMM|nr:ABC transporter permease [Marinomonas transparens]MBJ7537653.1 ABC transporter permease [Marinomonas transparens]
MNKNSPLALLFNIVFLTFMLAPLVIICLVAFTSNGYISLPTNGFSLRWFRAIFEDSQFVDAFYLSIKLGVVSATIAILIAVPAALAFARYDFKGRSVFMALFLSPMMVPHIVLGVAFLSFLTTIGWYGTFIGIVLSHVIIVMPYALRLVLSSVVGLDQRAEKAAVSLGASNWVVFRHVTLPMILPGVVGGWVLSFITSFDEVTMSVFVASPSTTTLPVKMYAHITETIDPLIASLSALMIFITMAVMFLLDRFYGLDKILVGKGK